MTEFLSELLKKETLSIGDFESNMPSDLFSRTLRPQEVSAILKASNALWMYEGPPQANKPHALLHSGKHSNGYADVGSVLKNYPNVRKLFAHSLALLVIQENMSLPSPIDWVVGADTSSTLLAEDVAQILGVKHIKMKKVANGKEKVQIWDETNPDINSVYGNGLQVEELITTAASAMEVRKGMNEMASQMGRVFTFNRIMPTIVNRSDPKNRVSKIDDSKIRALLFLNIENYEPEECPYCQAGSEAIKPKEGSNWSRITAK
jgi:orotate phosphoribosyltransferase